eukprot:gene27580-34323_t
MEAAKGAQNFGKSTAEGVTGITKAVGNVAIQEVTAIIALIRSLLTSLPFFFAIGSLVLVSVWASREGTNWLGVPNWGSNIFPWHPVLMTAGFFFAQVLAILSWQVDAFPTNASSVTSWQRFFHVFWNTAALATLIAALYVVFKYKANVARADLTTTHEWSGILIAVLFLLQYLLGWTFSIWRGAAIMHGGLAHHTPIQNTATFTSIAGLRRFHKFMGIFILLLTASNILSGIVQRQLNCSYPRRWTSDPAYPGLDLGCRISNGLAVLVWLTTLFTVLAVASRYEITPRDVGVRGNSEAILDHEILGREASSAAKGGLYEDVKGSNHVATGGAGGASGDRVSNDMI